jgi:hypothetical protein
MPKGHITLNYNSPLLILAKRKNLTVTDVCRMLQMSKPTFYKYVKNPSFLSIVNVITLSGLFNIKPEVLFYLLVHNVPTFNKKSKKNWYSEGIETDINKEKDLI